MQERSGWHHTKYECRSKICGIVNKRYITTLKYVDEMAILHWMPHSFKHKKHLIMYEPTNQTEFDNLLEYYVMNEAEAEAIGRSGYEHTLAHHMTTDRVSYILDNIESKLKLQPI